MAVIFSTVEGDAFVFLVLKQKIFVIAPLKKFTNKPF